MKYSYHFKFRLNNLQIEDVILSSRLWMTIIRVKRICMYCIKMLAKHLKLNMWWRHQMEKYSALLALCAGNSPVTGEFPSQRPVTRSFYDFFDLRLNKRLRQSRRWWFETQSQSLWRQRNVTCQASLICPPPCPLRNLHYCDVIMNVIASQITSVSIVYSSVCSDADQR